MSKLQHEYDALCAELEASVRAAIEASRKLYDQMHGSSGHVRAYDTWVTSAIELDKITTRWIDFHSRLRP
jgi:hypothetical protein